MSISVLRFGILVSVVFSCQDLVKLCGSGVLVGEGWWSRVDRLPPYDSCQERGGRRVV